MLTFEDFSKIRKALNELDEKVKKAKIPETKINDNRMMHKSLYVWCIISEFDALISTEFKTNPEDDSTYDKLLEVFEFLDIFNLNVDANEELEETLKFMDKYIDSMYTKIDNKGLKFNDLKLSENPEFCYFLDDNEINEKQYNEVKLLVKQTSLDLKSSNPPIDLNFEEKIYNICNRKRGDFNFVEQFIKYFNDIGYYPDVFIKLYSDKLKYQTKDND